MRVFALAISALTGQRISDTTFGLRAMRAEVTGAVRLDQPQYQASELLIGVITHGYRVAERPATIRRRKIGKSKKGNNAFYAMRFAKVVVKTWWRERQRRVRGPADRPERDARSSPGAEPLADGVIANGAGPEPAAGPECGDGLGPDASGFGPRSLKST